MRFSEPGGGVTVTVLCPGMSDTGFAQAAQQKITTMLKLMKPAPVLRAVLQGGVANREGIPPALLKEMYLVGNRPGHYRAFIRLLRQSASWEAATASYKNISLPVHIVWGGKDWSRSVEREHDRSLIPSAHIETVENGGHFLPFDRPDALVDLHMRIGRGSDAG